MFQEFLHDESGDMAEKAVIMAAIIIAAYTAFRLLGNNISSLVNNVAGWLH